MQTAKTLIRLGDAQADLSFRWAHTHFVGFVMSRLIWNCEMILKFEQKGSTIKSSVLTTQMKGQFWTLIRLLLIWVDTFYLDLVCPKTYDHHGSSGSNLCQPT